MARQGPHRRPPPRDRGRRPPRVRPARVRGPRAHRGLRRGHRRRGRDRARQPAQPRRHADHGRPPREDGRLRPVDLTATIGGNAVDTASGISYELGSGDLIDGIDEALESLTAGESTTFESKLLGGDNEGETAEIAVTVQSVKERELPEADDDFAQIASEFDTIDELRADLKVQVGKSKVFGQVTQARDQIVDKLLEGVEIPVPEKLVEDEVQRHLENENRLEDDVHRAEVKESSEKAFRQQLLLDVIAEKEELKVSQDELTQYLIQGAQQYNMEPNEFVQVLQQNNQIPAMVGDVAHNKALAVVLDKAKVVDADGKVVDVTEFTKPVVRDADAVSEEPADADAEAVVADAPAEEAAEAPAAEEAPAEKPKKKAPAKKKASEKAADSE